MSYEILKPLVTGFGPSRFGVTVKSEKGPTLCCYLTMAARGMSMLDQRAECSGCHSTITAVEASTEVFENSGGSTRKSLAPNSVVLAVEYQKPYWTTLGINKDLAERGLVPGTLSETRDVFVAQLKPLKIFKSGSIQYLRISPTITVLVGSLDEKYKSRVNVDKSLGREFGVW